MDTIQTLLTVAIWFLCPILILLILVQGGAGDLSSTFGGGGQLDSTLGVGASRKMGKLTGWLSVLFLAMVLFMAIPPGGAYPTPPGTDGDASAAVLEDPDGEPARDPLNDAEIDAAVQGITGDLPETVGDDVEGAAPAQPVDESAPAPEGQETEADKQGAGLEIEVDQPATEE